MAGQQPIDPDIEVVELVRAGHPELATRAFSWEVAAAVFVGGLVGGLARYAAGRGWPAHSGGFPWAIFWVNVSGAFTLAVLIAIAGEHGHRLIRPTLGTGFLGAYTTFSSLVVATDELAAHGHPATAGAYLLASVSAGFVGALAGQLLGKAIARQRGGGDAPEGDPARRGGDAARVAR